MKIKNSLPVTTKRAALAQFSQIRRIWVYDYGYMTMPGGPTEVFDIYMKEPISFTQGMIFVSGKFQFIDDIKSGLYFRLVNATAKIDEPIFNKKSILSQPPV